MPRIAARPPALSAAAAFSAKFKFLPVVIRVIRLIKLIRAISQCGHEVEYPDRAIRVIMVIRKGTDCASVVLLQQCRELVEETQTCSRVDHLEGSVVGKQRIRRGAIGSP